ncbi:IS91 family transposase ISTha3 [subsurface metagenome]
MISEMQIRNYSPRTIKTYVSLMAGLSGHYHISPEEIATQQFKDYIAFRVQHQNVSVSTVNQLIGAWKILQTDILGRKWEDFSVKRPRKEKKIPVVLSRTEALKLIKVLPNIKHSALLSPAYATGMRRSEVLNLEPRHIDAERKVIKVVAGKGHKQRQIPICDSLIRMLRNYYKKYHPKTFLFEGFKPEKKYTETSFAKVVTRAAKKASMNKVVSPHVLRHSFATHMLEKGINLKKLQLILGHNAMKTTSIYLHVANMDNLNLPDLISEDEKN